MHENSTDNLKKRAAIITTLAVLLGGGFVIFDNPGGVVLSDNPDLNLSAVSGECFENTVTVNGSVLGYNFTVSTDHTVYYANIQVNKTVERDSIQPGMEIVYSYRITNLGCVDLEDIVVNDTSLGVNTMDCSYDLLEANETVVCNITTVINDTTTNNVTVCGNATGFDFVVCGSDSATVYCNRVVVSKVADVSVARKGDNITYTINITNYGGNLTNLTIIDSLTGEVDPLSCSLAKNTLDHGETTLCNVTFTINESTENLVVVEGNISGDLIRSSGYEFVYVVDVTFTKTVLPNQTFSIGETVVYVFTINNTGDTTVENFTLTDDVLGDLSIDTEHCSGDFMDFDMGSVVCKYESRIYEDTNNTGNFSYVVENNTFELTDDASVVYCLPLVVTKVANDTDISCDDTVEYTINITSVNCDWLNVSVLDSFPEADLNKTINILAGESEVFKYNKTFIC